jgi:hypothetical protein
MSVRSSLIRRPSLLHSPPKLLQQVLDSPGQPVAEFVLYDRERILGVHWHGHLTSEEIIRVATASLDWQARIRPLGLLNDKRGTTGEWDEAMPWVEYEWTPRARAGGLQAFAYVIAPDLMMSFNNLALINQIRQSIDLRTFFHLGSAWKWLRQHATQRAV